jgi:O-antigen ligase
LKIHVNRRVSERLASTLPQISFSLLILLVLLTPLIEMSGFAVEGSKAYRFYAYVILLILQFVMVPIRGWQRTQQAVTTPVAALLIWFCMSLLWADHFALASRRTSLICLIYLSIFGAVADLGYHRSLTILRIFLAFALLLNFIAVFAIPTVGTQPWYDFDLWRGFMAHKNIAGMLCAVTILVFAFDAGKLAQPFRVVVLFAAAVFLYQSWSRSAIVALSIALAFGLALGFASPATKDALVRHEKSLKKVLWFVLGFLIVLIAGFTIERDTMVSFTNDAAAFSLRNSIWRPVVQFYLDHPVLGSGYGAYWDGPVAAEGARAFSTQKWLMNVDQAHNGYLDLMVQTGLVGLSLALFAAFAWPISRLSVMTDRQQHRAALIFALLVFILAENFSESSLFADDAIGNVVLLFALAQVRRFELRSISKVRRGRRTTE